MRFVNILSLLLAKTILVTGGIVLIDNKRYVIDRDASASTNGLITYDEHSLMVKGERILFYSGEFHPFRLPVPGLWLDVLQKIKALGYNGVSFYTDWALLEGKPGTFSADGIFDLQPFFDAAKTAGIYLIARPGPHINAEVSGGGLPGWQSRNPAKLRVNDPRYLDTTNLYMAKIGAIFAKNQITNGGPIVLVQPENEDSQGPNCCEPDYFAAVQKQLRDAGLVVPFISNDAGPYGLFLPGSGTGAIDIYGYDGYPLGFDCANPSYWGSNSLPTNWGQLHLQQSPSTPHSVVEFQAGSFDPWGGAGFTKCSSLLGSEFETVFYKNIASFATKILNLYMTFGGTNWGNLGHPSGYTSYDYGSAITEQRLVNRDKYTEAKLIANSLRSFPAYLTGVYQDSPRGKGAYTGDDRVYVTAVSSNSTKFLIARQSAHTSTFSITYKLNLPTSQGTLTVPQLGGSLALNGRDSKIHVVDADLQGINLLYSTAEIFTSQYYNDQQRILVIFGKVGETHEFAITNGGDASLAGGQSVNMKTNGSTTIVNFTVANRRSIIQFSKGLLVYVVDKTSVGKYWILDSNPSGTTKGLPIVNLTRGYLVRNVTVGGSNIAIYGDLTESTPIEVLGVGSATSLTWNGQKVTVQKTSKLNMLSGQLTFQSPPITLPDLSKVSWKVIDSLPEVSNSYNDDKWVQAPLKSTNNTSRPNLDTPTNLYASDYGFHSGSIISRGHFVSDGTETTFKVSTQGGLAFGSSVWINNTFLGSFAGNPNSYYSYDTYNLPTLTKGTPYVFTVLIDHMGYNEDWQVGTDSNKEPRGVMEYEFSGRPKDSITWKLTGNLGGEDYIDKVRGPLNEGGMFAERKGYHLPNPPSQNWKDSKGPTEGISKAGVSFFTTTFNLNLPSGYDIPLSLDFGSSALTSSSNYRCQVFVNGYQFGKFVSNLGPQTSFPVPEGILNYHGSNTVAVTLWALDKNGAKPPAFNLMAGPTIQSGYGPIALSPAPAYSVRANSY